MAIPGTGKIVRGWGNIITAYKPYLAQKAGNSRITKMQLCLDGMPSPKRLFAGGVIAGATFVGGMLAVSGGPISVLLVLGGGAIAEHFVFKPKGQMDDAIFPRITELFRKEAVKHSELPATLATLSRMRLDRRINLMRYIDSNANSLYTMIDAAMETRAANDPKVEELKGTINTITKERNEAKEDLENKNSEIGDLKQVSRLTETMVKLLLGANGAVLRGAEETGQRPSIVLQQRPEIRESDGELERIRDELIGVKNKLRKIEKKDEALAVEEDPFIIEMEAYRKRILTPESVKNEALPEDAAASPDKKAPVQQPGSADKTVVGTGARAPVPAPEGPGRETDVPVADKKKDEVPDVTYDEALETSSMFVLPRAKKEAASSAGARPETITPLKKRIRQKGEKVITGGPQASAAPGAAAAGGSTDVPRSDTSPAPQKGPGAGTDNRVKVLLAGMGPKTTVPTVPPAPPAKTGGGTGEFPPKMTTIKKVDPTAMDVTGEVKVGSGTVPVGIEGDDVVKQFEHLGLNEDGPDAKGTTRKVPPPASGDDGGSLFPGADQKIE